MVAVQKMNKVLILGSGALQIGQAGEFDYSGSQALKALKEEGVTSIVINPNIATVQTSEGMADIIYFVPVTPYFTEQVIKKEKPGGILLGFGGQTALNCGIELHNNGILKKYNVKVLGTPAEAILATEDRELFKQKLAEVSIDTPRSMLAVTKAEGMSAADKIGYPLIVRAGFALGGMGSGIATGREKLEKILDNALSVAPHVLIEECLAGWKEVEYEVVRDNADNCITVCNMENFDPMGIHTGESIVVAPSQTLTNHEYHKLREISIRIIRHLGIVGECNIQFALNPESDEYRVIEVNARLSRSSALASKATGYPLAYVAAKLALGHNLTEVSNSITKKTIACFEPALDYLVLKIPRWDMAKFKQIDESIGTEMKSVGEVMAIGRSFEEVLQKGLRMLDLGFNGLVANSNGIAAQDFMQVIRQPTDKRVFAIAKAFEKGRTIDEIHDLSKIDKWFLRKIQNIVELANNAGKPDRQRLLELKKAGFSDRQIAILTGKDEQKIRELRKKSGIVPVVKQIDTLAGEFPAMTNYLYVTYNGTESDISSSEEKAIIVLGSGAYRIGSSVEFDWCCVNAQRTAKSLGYKTIMINYNPETVSTDYDESDRLYFEELSLERVLDIQEIEQSQGIIVSMGGQIPNSLALRLDRAGCPVLGTNPKDIDRAEDRNKFSKLCNELEIDQPAWKELTDIKSAKAFAKEAEYPVLIRPSYVLSGAAMNIVYSDEMLEEFMTKATVINPEHPVVISKFIENAKEIEIDAVASKGIVVAYAISEHVENAGVHSGDATMILPPQRLYLETVRRIKKVARRLAEELLITGPFNIQFIAKENKIKVIECNLRASRSFPFVSKVFKVNFIELATRAMLGNDVKPVDKSSFDLDYVGVKAPQFSFSRLKGADPVVGVEMASTGEVGCLGSDMYDAYLKAVMSTGMRLPEKNILVSIGGEDNRERMVDVIRKFADMGFRIYATESTGAFFRKHGIETVLLHKIHEKKQPNIYDFLIGKKLDLIISMPKIANSQEQSDSSIIRRAAVEFGIPLINNIQNARFFANAIGQKRLETLEVMAWGEYK